METGKSIITLEQLRARRGEIENIAKHRGAHHVRVFGSVARGDATPESDIDFLVEMEPGRTVLDLSELILDLEETLGRKVDVIELRRPSPLADEIRTQAVPL